MVSVILGLLFLAFAVFAVLPQCPLAWGQDVLSFLRGSIPVFAAFVGLICLFIGAADIKDKKEARAEEKTANEKDVNEK